MIEKPDPWLCRGRDGSHSPLLPRSPAPPPLGSPAPPLPRSPARMRLLIWGAGGHGKVVADLVRALGHELAGYVDADAGRLGRRWSPAAGGW
jgi:hypothetical protein